jgi:hypothetical protein
MTEILGWLQQYSAGVVVLIAIGAALLYLMKLLIEKTIDNSLKRRSAFEEKVLTDRFTLLASFSSRMHKVTTTLNRVRAGQPCPDGFFEQNEIVPLTTICEDISANRLVLGETFHQMLFEKTDAMVRLANAHDDDVWNAASVELAAIDSKLLAEAERVFGISRIAW